MRRRASYLWAGVLGAALAATPGQAGDAVTYTYDALGRLVTSATTGTVNNGLSVSTGYDPAGNRANYYVAGGSGQPVPPPTPNQPPTAVNDTGSQQKCATATYNVTANDSDPEGNYPLAVTSVSGQGFSVVSGTSLQFISTASTGAKVGTYTVQDTLGATATATLTVTVSGGAC